MMYFVAFIQGVIHQTAQQRCGMGTTFWSLSRSPKSVFEMLNNLGAPIRTLEVQEAIKLLQNGKSPGSDGFIVVRFCSACTPCLLGVYCVFSVFP